jgi:RNA recognition motif-containing protein
MPKRKLEESNVLPQSEKRVKTDEDGDLLEKVICAMSFAKEIHKANKSDEKLTAAYKSTKLAVADFQKIYQEAVESKQATDKSNKALKKSYKTFKQAFSIVKANSAQETKTIEVAAQMPPVVGGPITKKSPSASKPLGPSDEDRTPVKIMFLGQLPYTATVPILEAFFKQHLQHPFKVRLLTEKHTNKPRGIGFLEVSEVSDIERALALHHTNLQGRVINIELTARGGNLTENRKKKLEDLKQQQNAKTRAQVEQLVDECIADSEGRLVKKDFDTILMDALFTFPFLTVRELLVEAARPDKGGMGEGINNRSAWLMGLVKRYRGQLLKTANVGEKPDAKSYPVSNGRGGRGGRGVGTEREGRGRNSARGDGGRGEGAGVCFAFQQGRCSSIRKFDDFLSLLHDIMFFILIPIMIMIMIYFFILLFLFVNIIC